MPGMARRTVIVATLLMSAALGVAAQQPAPAAGRRRRDQPRERRQRQPAAAGAEDRPRLELRRGEGRRPTRCRIRWCSPTAQPVTNAGTWTARRRPEIMRALRDADLRAGARERAEGRRGSVTETDPNARDGTVTIKRIVGTIGERRGRAADQADALYAGRRAQGRVPVILLVNFGGGTRRRRRRAGAPPRAGEPPVAADILAPRLGLRDDPLSGHPARSQQHVPTKA